jgi:hypothetical protein
MQTCIEHRPINRPPHWAAPLTLLAALASGSVLVVMAAPEPAADDDLPRWQPAGSATPQPETAP